MSQHMWIKSLLRRHVVARNIRARSWCDGASKSILLGRMEHGQRPAAALVAPRRWLTTDPQVQQHDDSSHRISQLKLHPDSLGQYILPGGEYVPRTNPKTGKTRNIVVDRAFGYFWKIQDLQKTNNKPILSNTTLIPLDLAQEFPPLDNCVSLSDTTRNASLLSFLLQHNRTRDPTATCTLVTISFRHYGFQLLQSWTDPFREHLVKDNLASRVQVYNLNIVEGWWMKMFLLKRVITANLKTNTSLDEHSTTLLQFGSVPNFVDALRMHNTLTGYVFLLDGLGRVRFASSGQASPKEIKDLMDMTRELLQADKASSGSNTSKPTPNKPEPKRKPQRGRNFQQHKG